MSLMSIPPRFRRVNPLYGAAPEFDASVNYPEVADPFSTIVGRLDYPMFIVTVAGREPAGCLVGFATQCSIDPPRFLVCLSEKNRTCRVAGAADALAVHFVPAAAEELAELFGGRSGDEVDKFARCEWHEGPAGLPILDRCPSWFAGRILERRRLGDHVGHLIEPFAGEAAHSGRAFPFSRAKHVEPGHEA